MTKVMTIVGTRPEIIRLSETIKLIDEQVEPGLDVHLIMDNYATHKAPPVMTWLAKHPRFHFHFTPTHASWLNQVEGLFSVLTEKQLKRGSHHSVRQLERSIQEFLDAHNQSPTPFRWVKTADEILAKVARYCSDTVRFHARTTSDAN